MATGSILPEKFEHGDFSGWMRQFECCATANGWNAAQKLQKLPAFLRGIAATHFHALDEDQKDTFEHLVANLQSALCPDVAREIYFREFEGRVLRDHEDPSLFLYSLQELLKKADSTLSDTATEALLSRQFMKGLADTMRFKLLEHNPKPTLVEMVAFCKQFLAVRKECQSQTACAAIPLQESINDRERELTVKVEKLTQLVEKLATEQQKTQNVVASIQPPIKPKKNGEQQSKDIAAVSASLKCFCCKEPGHFARHCPLKPPGRREGVFRQQQREQTQQTSIATTSSRCILCDGWGHFASQCANNWTVDRNFRPAVSGPYLPNSSSLNSQGVPH